MQDPKNAGRITSNYLQTKPCGTSKIRSQWKPVLSGCQPTTNMSTVRVLHVITTATIVLCCLLRPSLAQVSWVNRDGGFFESGSNWSDGTAPRSNESIFFGVPGDYPVSFLADHTVTGMVVSAQSRPTFGPGQHVDRTLTVDGDILINLGAQLTLDSSDTEGRMIIDNSGYEVILNGSASEDQGGKLSLRDGSELTSRTGVLGHTPDLVGRLHMSGEQTSWTMDDLIVGLDGAAVVDVESGASLISNLTTRIGDKPGGTATIDVRGVGINGRPSTWSTHGVETIIGKDADVDISVSGGAGVSLSPMGSVQLAGQDVRVHIHVSGRDASGNATTLTTGNLEAAIFGGNSKFTIEQGAEVKSGLTAFGRFGDVDVNLTGSDGAGNASLWSAQTVSLRSGMIEISNGARLEVEETLDIADDGVLNVLEGAVSVNRLRDRTSDGLTLFPDATIEFNRYEGDLSYSVGTVAPGIDAAVSTIAGSLQQQPGGILALELSGTSRHDAVAIGGVADFGGSLEVRLAEGFVPESTDTFPVLSATTIVGAFENVFNGQRLDTADGRGSFVVNYGPTSVFEADRIILSDFLLSVGTLAGDFNNDGMLDSNDIDLLSSAVGGNDTSFDLTSDGVINGDDRKVWVEDLKRTYFGDANLDGEFNSGDFVQVFQRGHYEDTVVGNSGWADGDWNGDGEFDSGDFVIAFQSGSYETGSRAASAMSPSNLAAVPEPNGHIIAMLALFSLSVFRPGSARKS